MSNSPYLTLDDLKQLKDASKYYSDYLITSGVRRDAPEVFKKFQYTNLRLLDFVQLWEQYPGIGDQVQIKKPAREI